MSQAAPYLHYFTGYVQEGKIYEQNYSGTKQLGVINDVYTDLQTQHTELLSISESYRERLVELGALEIPMTQEETIKKQGEQLQQMQAVVMNLSVQMKQFMEAVNGHCIHDESDSGHEHGADGQNDAGVSNSPKHPANKGRNPQLRKPTQRKNN